MATTVPARKPTGADRPLPVAVFPGNVGDDALADLVALLLGRTP